MTARPPQQERLDRRLAAAVAAWAAAAAVLGLSLAWSRLDEDKILQTPAFAALLAVGLLSPLAAPLAARRLRRSCPSGRLLLQLAFSSFVALWLGLTAASPSFHAGRIGAAVAAWAAFALALLALLPARPGPWRRAGPPLAAASFALVLCELLLRAAAVAAPTPLLATSSSTTAQRFAAYAFAPGSLHFGRRTNSLGFFDDEFLPRGSRARPAVAVIGDSFSASFVPHDRHYTTVAEGLVDADLWNVGWAAMGPAEYRAMLEQYVLPADPDAVLVSLFLGNDLAESSPAGPLDRAMAAWWDRGNVLLCALPQRLLRLASSHEARTGALAHNGDLDRASAWLDDPLLEPGTMSEEEFLRIETERARCNAALPAGRLRTLKAEIRRLRQLAGARPFGIVLIPDESMVEDELWARVTQAAGPLRRHALREELLAFLAEEGVPALDLLPPLLAAEPWPADGKRHLYLLRDTHWNARGNRVAGAALAPFVQGLLQGRLQGR